MLLQVRYYGANGELWKRLKEHGLSKETENSIKAKLKRGTDGEPLATHKTGLSPRKVRKQLYLNNCFLKSGPVTRLHITEAQRLLDYRCNRGLSNHA